MNEENVLNKTQRYVRFEGKYFSIIGMLEIDNENVLIGDTVKVKPRAFFNLSETEFKWILPQVVEVSGIDMVDDSYLFSVFATKNKEAIEKEAEELCLLYVEMIEYLEQQEKVI